MRMQRFYPRNMADYFSKSAVLAFFYVDFYLKPGPPMGFDFPGDMEKDFHEADFYRCSFISLCSGFSSTKAEDFKWDYHFSETGECLLYLHLNFRISLSVSSKMPARILFMKTLNSQWRKVIILTTLMKGCSANSCNKSPEPFKRKTASALWDTFFNWMLKTSD